MNGISDKHRDPAPTWSKGTSRKFSDSDRHNVPLSNEKIRQAIRTVTEEREEEECDSKRNANNVTMDTFCQSPVMNNKQGKIANIPNERRISYNILVETIKGFKGLTLQSTINNSSYYH